MNNFNNNKELTYLTDVDYQYISDAPQLLIGFSGGLDSTVLLNTIVAKFGSKKILAVHVNHQIHPDAGKWQQHCEEVATQHHVDFVAEKVTLNSGQGSGSLEEQARNERYRVFEQHLSPEGVLLLGHHADDHIETLLFRLFRGSGAKGLSAIPPRRKFSLGILVRPFLNLSKKELLGFAEQSRLTWVEDPSNQQSDFDRNFLRNNVLPQLRTRWRHIDRTLLASATMFQETDQLLADLADVDLKQCGQQTETLGVSIDADKLKTLEKHRRHNLLRRWIYLSEGYQVSNTVLDTFYTDVLGASFEAAPVLHVGGHTLYRFRSRIFLVPKLPLPHALDNFLPVDWDSTKPLDLPNVWRLEQLGGKADVYHVDRRRGGERLQPNGRAHSQRLKKVMLEASVLPWLRDLLPIVYSNQAIVAVGDQIICGEKRFRLHWLIEQPKRFR